MSGGARAKARAEILAGVAQVAREHLGVERALGLDERLVEELDLDSIRLLTLAAEVENHFQISLDPEDEARIATVGDLVAAIEAKLGASKARREADPMLE